ncbi:MAG: DUF4249 family protein [Hymenobacteraceae bacterium]|nr:DUF4249 family protein [Hymenobacteraceae bacterium]
MNRFPTFALLTLLTAATACETVVDVPEPAHTPQLALRYILGTTAQDTAARAFFAHRQLFISTSQRLYDTRPLQGRSDATARLFDEAGTVVEEFRAGRPFSYYGSGFGDTLGYYEPTRNFVPQPGRTYRLQVEAPGVDVIESRLTLPGAPAQLLGGRFARTASSDPYETRGRLTVSIQDDGATTDAYLAFARVVDSTGAALLSAGVFPDYEANDADTDLQGAQLELSFPGNLSGLLPYPDTDVAGRAFPLTTNVVVSGYNPQPGMSGLPAGARLEVTISRLTLDTYRFLVSLRRYTDTDGNIFAEPAPLISNVEPGYGVFGGAVDATVRMPLN